MEFHIMRIKKELGQALVNSSQKSKSPMGILLLQNIQSAKSVQSAVKFFLVKVSIFVFQILLPDTELRENILQQIICSHLTSDLT